MLALKQNCCYESLFLPTKVDGITDRDKLKIFTEEYVYICCKAEKGFVKD